MQVVADHFGAGIDDTHIKMRGAPVLEEASLSSHQKMIADKLSVSELMTMALVALPPVARVSYAHTPGLSALILQRSCTVIIAKTVSTSQHGLCRICCA